MILRIFVYLSLLIPLRCLPTKHRCLTGYMTEVQSWVDIKGVLTIGSEDYDRAVDLSANSNAVQVLEHKITFMRLFDSSNGETGDADIRYLSLARCQLSVVPTVFQLKVSSDHHLAETLEYITFYGNVFTELSTSGELYDVTINATDARAKTITSPFQRQLAVTWSRGFEQTDFLRLKELDLRACSIQVISNNVFKRMPNLEALYIGENEVLFIEDNAFVGLRNLIHLDFSRNVVTDEKGNLQSLSTDWSFIFKALDNLLSLDLSFTKLSRKYVSLLTSLGPKLKRLSLCETGISNLKDGTFSRTTLRILDLSGNNGIFQGTDTLRGLEDTLEVLYAKDTGLKTLDVFENFKKLEVLDLSVNEISSVNPQLVRSLRNLQILDLARNRVPSWFVPTFSFMPNLKLLNLNENNMNLISEDMIEDLRDVKYIAMSGNFIVCNCHTRDFFDLALQNEQRYSPSNITEKNKLSKKPRVYEYHRGFTDFNEQLSRRNVVTIDCDEAICNDFNEEQQGNFLLLDFVPSAYMCLLASESKPVSFSYMSGCSRSSRDVDYDNVLQENVRTLYALLIIPGILIIMMVIFMFRRNLRYFLITLRNSAMLSLIHKNEFIDDCTIFHYDVFVSYCNEDRNWVLDQLLPHLESDCSVSACLHERDFQVGHSILENIVSCMDRSKSIMLIISQRFLLSQWCQFEMHLAQHRLLETRREDLTLVLLEEIPRRLRPNTLHYLMLTKTYIVWPGESAERELFWRRVKKSLVNIKLRHTSLEGVSLA